MRDTDPHAPSHVGRVEKDDQLLLALAETLPAAVFIYQDQRLRYANEAATVLTGQSDEESLSLCLAELIPPDLLAALETDCLEASPNSKVSDRRQLKIRTKDGEARWLDVSFAVVDYAGKPAVLGAALDVTEKKREEESRAQLVRRLVNAREEERRRVSRELHDQIGQHVTALIWGLKWMETQCRCQTPAQDRLPLLRDLSEQLARDAHQLAWDLRPPALDDLGLTTALRRYAQEWSTHSGIPLDLHCGNVDENRLPAHLEVTLFRVIQEALTNVLRHAQASRAGVVLERRRHEARAIVEDDGRGFDGEAATTGRGSEGRLGLLGMRERVALVGGTLEIESSRDSGTTIFIRIPLPSDGPERQDT